MDYSRHVWEGWTAQAFIDELAPLLDMIMAGRSWRKPLKTRAELEVWCAANQPYYKKTIPEVVSFFADRYGIK